MYRLRPAALLLLMLAGSAAAATPPPTGDALLRAQCADETGHGVSPEQKVAACAALIEAGRLEHDELALTYARRADGYYRTHQFDRAIADYDTSLASYGDAIPGNRLKLILNARGYTYVNQLRFARAVQDFDRAIAIDPAYAPAYAGRGGAYAYLGLGARALQDFDRALTLQPQSVLALLGRGTVDLRTGEIARATTELDFVIQAGTAEPAAYYYRGLARFAAGHFDLALQDLDMAITLAPDEAPMRDARDHVRAARDNLAGRTAAAMPDAPMPNPAGAVPSRAVGRTHDCSELYPDMARRLHESGDVLIGYDVDDKGAIGNVAVAKPSGSSRLDRAAVACVSALWRNTPALRDGNPVASPGHQAIIRFFNAPVPTNVEQFVERGSAWADVGDYARAMADLDHAVALDPNAAESLYWRGLVEQATGRLDRAAADYAAAIRLQPDLPGAADARDLAASELAAPAVRPPPQVPPRPDHSI